MTPQEQAFAQSHDHTSPNADGCMFCLAVEGIEAWNPKYKGVPLAERRVKELNIRSTK
jgi:hypothetical protein